MQLAVADSGDVKIVRVKEPNVDQLLKRIEARNAGHTSAGVGSLAGKRWRIAPNRGDDSLGASGRLRRGRT